MGVVEEVESQEWGDQKELMVTVQSDEPLDRITQVAFITPDGKAIESRVAGGGASYGDKPTYSVIYALTGAPQTVNMKVTYYDKIEKKTFPIDRKITLGL